MFKDILNAQNGHIEIKGTGFDYIRFGTGREALIMLPGVGDGFKTAKGIALPFAFMYRKFAPHFTVYVFSRRNDLPDKFTSKDMADDINDQMEELGVEKAHIFGVSQGGMIAQQLAINYPERVRSLLLAVTASRPNAIMREALTSWLAMADADDYKGIMLDTAERSYTGKYLRRAKVTNALIGAVKPNSYERFRILCESCLEHDCFDKLDRISCPAMILAADRDKVLGADASIEMAERIPACKLFVYSGYSHGVYEQAPDFNERVLGYLLEV